MAATANQHELMAVPGTLTGADEIKEFPITSSHLLHAICARLRHLPSLLSARQAAASFRQPAAECIEALLASNGQLNPAAWTLFSRAVRLLVRLHPSLPPSEFIARVNQLLLDVPQRLEQLRLEVDRRGAAARHGRLVLDNQQGQTLVASLTTCRCSNTLKDLTFRGISISPDVANSLASALPGLQALSMMLCELAPSTNQPKYVPNLPRGLKRLNLSCQIAPDQLPREIDAEALASSAPSLEQLTISGPITFKHREALSKLTALKSLNLPQGEAGAPPGFAPPGLNVPFEDPTAQLHYWDILAALPSLQSAHLRSMAVSCTSDEPVRVAEHLTSLSLSKALWLNVPQELLPGLLATASPELAALRCSFYQGLAPLLLALRGAQELRSATVTVHLPMNAAADATQRWQQLQPAGLGHLPGLEALELALEAPPAQQRRGLVSELEAAAPHLAACGRLRELRLAAAAPFTRAWFRCMARPGACPGLRHVTLTVRSGEPGTQGLGFSLEGLARLLGSGRGRLESAVVRCDQQSWVHSLLQAQQEELLEALAGGGAAAGTSAGAAAAAGEEVEQEEVPLWLQLVQGFVASNELLEQLGAAAEAAEAAGCSSGTAGTATSGGGGSPKQQQGASRAPAAAGGASSPLLLLLSARLLGAEGGALLEVEEAVGLIGALARSLVLRQQLQQWAALVLLQQVALEPAAGQQQGGQLVVAYDGCQLTVQVMGLVE